MIFLRKKQLFYKRLTGLILAGFMFAASCIPAEAAYVTTSIEGLPSSKYEAYVTATVNSRFGKRSFHIFNQGMWGKNRKAYVPSHGCAVCSLTTVLSGYTKKYADYTPNMTRTTLERQVFGAAWRRNYKRSVSAQMPVSLYGISRVLQKCGVRNKYVRSFSSDKKTENILARHLRKGEVVVIETNNHRQKNGRISSKYDSKWARSRHTMVLLGMTSEGYAIVGDSANRDWAGNSQRIKLAKLSDLIAHMIPHSPSGKSFYYSGDKCYSGYILVNP